MFFAHYFKEMKLLKPYIITIVVASTLGYLSYAFFSGDFVIKIGREDGFFEWMTALFFFSAAVTFFIVFLRTKNIFLLGLAFIFFMGAGEEISWGQRVFGFNTPESLNKVNVQHEFNLHNLEVFNDSDAIHGKKKGFERILEINMLFRLFSVTFCMLIPLFFLYMKPKWKMNKKLQMPVAPFTIGMFFFISWATFYSLKWYIFPLTSLDKKVYFLTSGEIFEFTAALIYFLIALYFFKRKDDGFLGKYPVPDK